MAAPEKDDPSHHGNGADPAKRGEFSRFEDLTRGLLKVPKSELDEKLKASKPSRSTRRK